MAVLGVDTSFELDELIRFIDIFPDLSGRFLALVGKRARTILKRDLLSGQEIDLTAFPVDRLGRFTVASDVNRARNAVKIYSYPANLFEKGRLLRSGRREAGKEIITGKLRRAVSAGMADYINEFENRILTGEIKRRGLS